MQPKSERLATITKTIISDFFKRYGQQVDDMVGRLENGLINTSIFQIGTITEMGILQVQFVIEQLSNMHVTLNEAWKGPKLAGEMEQQMWEVVEQGIGPMLTSLRAQVDTIILRLHPDSVLCGVLSTFSDSHRLGFLTRFQEAFLGLDVQLRYRKCISMLSQMKGVVQGALDTEIKIKKLMETDDEKKE